VLWQFNIQEYGTGEADRALWNKLKKPRQSQQPHPAVSTGLLKHSTKITITPHHHIYVQLAKAAQKSMCGEAE
jgi:hypothetical protein